MVVAKSQEHVAPETPVDDVPLTNGLAVEQFVSVGEAMMPTVQAKGRPHVVVIGAGFGGLELVKSLKKVDVDITLVDRRNHHLFVPLLYQVASAQLPADNIAQPIRRILKKQKNVTVTYDEATRVDVQGKKVELASGESLTYDYLTIAVGAKDSYFGHDEWAEHAPGLKSLENAETHRQNILLAFEAAEKEHDPARREALLTFVIIGGGPTGVEMAGAIAELAHHTLKNEFRNFKTSDAKIILLEGLPRVFPMFAEKLSKQATKDLKNLGVEVRTGSLVTDIDEHGVVVGGEERINAGTIVWAAGIQAASLTPTLKDQGVDLDRSGRVPVTNELTVPGHPEIFVIGDAAIIRAGDKPLGAVAPVAIQGGEHVAQNIQRSMRGDAYTAFHYNDPGSMATIGRNRAVVDIKGVQLTGFVAWVMWAGLHILRLINFRNRVAVFMQWAFDYFTYNRNARVIIDNRGDDVGSSSGSEREQT